MYMCKYMQIYVKVSLPAHLPLHYFRGRPLYQAFTVQIPMIRNQGEWKRTFAVKIKILCQNFKQPVIK